jgi:hypothetical protein
MWLLYFTLTYCWQTWLWLWYMLSIWNSCCISVCSPFIWDFYRRIVFIVVPDSLGSLWSTANSATTTLCESLMETAWTVRSCWHSCVVTIASHHLSCTLAAIKYSSSSCLTTHGTTQDSRQLSSFRQVHLDCAKYCIKCTSPSETFALISYTATSKCLVPSHSLRSLGPARSLTIWSC